MTRSHVAQIGWHGGDGAIRVECRWQHSRRRKPALLVETAQHAYVQLLLERRPLTRGSETATLLSRACLDPYGFMPKMHLLDLAPT